MKNYNWEQIGTATVAIKRDAGKLQDKIHAVACSILAHWVSRQKSVKEVSEALTNLQQASPYHAKCFADWVSVKTPLNWSPETELWYGMDGQKYSKEDLDAARAEPFWKVSPASKAKPLTDEGVLKLLEGILDKQERHEKKPVEGDDYSKKGNEYIRAAIAAIKG